MDSQETAHKARDTSMIESDDTTNSCNAPEVLEISESISLSPLTSSLDYHLTLQEDKLVSEFTMGLENTWSEVNHSTSDYTIPISVPPGSDEFVEIMSDPVDHSPVGVEHGPFLTTNSPTLNNLFADNVDTQGDTLIEMATSTGVCGLRNLGNTCFMAAGLQCLTATPPVLQHFLQLQQQEEKLLPPESLMARFSSLLSKMWSGRYRVVKPTEFKQTLGTYHSQFKDYRQHDCQEFLALLLDSLHEQMNFAKPVKVLRVTASTTTANLITSHKNGGTNTYYNSSITATCKSNTDFMDLYDNPLSPESPNSPSITVVGSPRDLESPTGDLDSTANSLQGSPLNYEEDVDDDIVAVDDDEQTLDSDEIVDTKCSFVNNKVQENGVTPSFTHQPLRLDKILELSKTATQCRFYDIIKDAKTNNANFLVTQQECNNEIHYDSQKFPKENIRRMILDNSNLTENHNFNNKTVSVKRIKEINLQKNHCNMDCISNSSDTECDNGLEKCNVKRMRLEEQEKNLRRDGLGQSDLLCPKVSQSCESGAIASQEEIEADKHWIKHLRYNKSVIVDTFQGQFKSTVVCEVCKHVSVTYEPFMYLSVPLPHAMERQIPITYIPANKSPPVRCVVSLNKQSKVAKLKEELLKTLGKENVQVSSIALAEVLENHIAKILENSVMLRHVNTTNRSIYAFELMEPPRSSKMDEEGERESKGKNEESDGWVSKECQNVTMAADENSSHTCMICFEEHDSDLKKHIENNCNIIMCDSCIETYFKNQPEHHICPVCNAHVTASSFTKIEQTRPVVRILNVPLVLRHDTNETTNNRKSTKLFGYPHLIKLPSRLNATNLYEVIDKIVPEVGNYTVHFVDGQGHHCSRCIYTTHCTGCKVPESGVIILQNGDTLAVRYTDNIPDIAYPVDHISVNMQRPHHPLSLYDCLQAFSQSEILDEHNPWFCPKCKQNQCATKTLTVHRYPKFLIVYLKRFVFYECVSMKLDDKVTFPLVGLSVGRYLYDLYACVCHFGGVSAGHYTAYAKNPQTDVWHYYNDETTSKQKPQDEDFSNAYILFYSRQGTNLKTCNI